MLLSALLSATSAVSALTVKGIHIARQGQNKSLVTVLKGARDLCEQERKAYAISKQNGPEIWALVEKDMKLKRPNYDPGRALAAEPNWSLIAIQREDEYFDGDKYALIREDAKYKIAEDGSCALLTEPTKVSDLDDGTYRYTLNLIKGTGIRYVSPLVTRTRGRQTLRNAMQNNPGLDGALADTMMNAGLGEISRAGADIGKVTGHDTVAGQQCDYHATGPGKGVEICYWSQMTRYPGILERPIILKSVVVLGGETNTKQAVLFETMPQIDSNIFQPPKGLTIKDRTGR
jgi:hypothetical protein